MILGNYSIRKILLAMNNALGGVSENLFTSRPKTVQANMNNFVVFNISSRIYDDIGKGSGMCQIDIFARDNGVYENTELLEQMQEAVYRALPISVEEYMIYRPISIQMGSDGMGFHSISIQCKILIKQQ
jgi:hypothetical protein